VNGRPVRNDRLAAAVRAGYGRLLPDGREPVATIDVSLQPARVDPNVHPAKREVGLRDADAVADAVESVVADALTGADLRRKAEVETGLDGALEPVGGEEGERLATFADADPIGTFCDLYLLVEAGDELLVVDGHAAHERVNYERLARAFDGEAVPTADLDPPVAVSLSADEAAAAEAHADALAALGFETEPFGGDRQAPDRPGAVRARGRRDRVPRCARDPLRRGVAAGRPRNAARRSGVSPVAEARRDRGS